MPSPARAALVLLLVSSCSGEHDARNARGETALTAAAATVPPDAARAAAIEPDPLWRQLTGRIARGQTLSHALAARGVADADVGRVIASLGSVCDFRRIRSGARLTIDLEAEDDSLACVTLENGPTEVYESSRVADGSFRGQRVAVELRREVHAVGAEIDVSLYAALDAAGETPELIGLVAEVFAWDIDLYRDPRPGDRVRLLVEKNYRDDVLVGYGRVLAARWQGSVRDAETFWFAPGGVEVDGDFYRADGQSARKFFLASPLQYKRVSSRFSYKRRHPILGYRRAHLGVDYAARTGTPVRAMAAGTVDFAGWAGVNGRMVRIRHRRGLTSSYSHLYRIGKGMKRGARVDQKQLIGKVGSSGRSTGPHLHFAVKDRGKFINPAKLDMREPDKVRAEHRSAFAVLVAKRMAELDAIALGGALVLSTDETR